MAENFCVIEDSYRKKMEARDEVGFCFYIQNIPKPNEKKIDFGLQGPYSLI